MRWLLLKDLQILRRSPLLTALLIVYPIVLAILIGFAISRDSGKPRVAFLNEVPVGEGLKLGGEDRFGQEEAYDEFCQRVNCVLVDDREEARDKVSDGEVLGAMILPEDFVDNLQSQLAGTGLEPAAVELIVNEDDPVKAQLVDDRVSALLTEANLILSGRISESLLNYLDVLVAGGEFNIPLLGQTIDVLGLKKTQAILEAIRGELQSPDQRRVVGQVIEFSQLARENLGFADELLASVAEPISVDKEAIGGDVPSLDTFAIAVAAAVTLMFVTVLLVAGSLALEREENTFSRLTRGLVGEGGLLVEKVALGIVCSLVVTLLLLGVLELFVSLQWDRVALFVPAILLGGGAFAAMGAAIGAATREVRASALLAFAVALPIAFLSLVPSGTVSETVFDVIQFVTGAFPFRPAVDALSGALSSTGPDLAGPFIHLALLAAAYLVLARLAVGRFARV